MNNYKCAPGMLEHTLCGSAFDAYESGDLDEPIIFAKKGEIVTCPECKLEIDYIKKTFNGYQVK